MSKSSSNPFALWLDKFFMISERGSKISTELLAGLVTFMNMAYILPVHSAIMAAAGMNQTGVLLGTCLASGLTTLGMGVYAKMPIGLAPGMGMNAMMAYTYIIGRNLPASFVLFCIMIEGALFFLFSLSPVREAVIRAIPYQLKMGISFGIGLFIFYIGLQNSGLVVDNPSTLTGMISFGDERAASVFAILTVVGLILICVLTIFKVPGAMLWGMIGIWVIGGICQACGIYTPNPEAGYYSLAPVYTPTDYSALGDVVGLCVRPDFQALFDMGMTLLQIIGLTIGIIIAFFYTDCFDTAGTTTACAYKADMLDEDGNFKDMGKVMKVDAGGTFFGTFVGLSPITAFVESISGIAAGAKTGLAAVVVGICFLLSMPFSSILTATPTFATSAALLMVGITMATAGKEIDWREEALPTLVPVAVGAISMLVFYSISEGIAISIILYVALHVLTGKAKEVNNLMYILFAVFVCRFIFL